MSEPTFYPGDKAQVKTASIKHPLEILAGPHGEHNVYWTLDEHGSYASYMADILDRIPPVLIGQAHFAAIYHELVKADVAVGTRLCIMDNLHRDYGEAK